MNVFIALCALIVLVTTAARGSDHPIRPNASGWRPWVRLHAEKLSLLAVGCTAGWALLLIVAGARVDPLLALMLAGTALWMLTHPNGWWAYITSLADDCGKRRADP